MSSQLLTSALPLFASFFGGELVTSVFGTPSFNVAAVLIAALVAFALVRKPLLAVFGWAPPGDASWRAKLDTCFDVVQLVLYVSIVSVLLAIVRQWWVIGNLDLWNSLGFTAVVAISAADIISAAGAVSTIF